MLHQPNVKRAYLEAMGDWTVNNVISLKHCILVSPILFVLLNTKM